MDFGVHLPLIDFDGKGFSLNYLVKYTQTAERLGYQALAANDHLIFSRPWLDGPTALAALLSCTGRMSLITTVALPVVRGPVTMAKTLAAIDILSGGRLVVGVGPGSSARDYALVGLSFEERWKRLDEAVPALRNLWSKEGAPFRGKFYSTEGIALEPYPARPSGPPIWIGSWGSDAGLRRTARLADGWLASAYNTTPELFKAAWDRLRENLPRFGKDPGTFPNAIATMLFYVADRSKAERVLREFIIPTFNRPEEELSQRFLIGPAEECAEKLRAYQAAGAERVFLWPVVDERRQLEIFQEQVAPLVPS